jgi:hypothetical protein
LDLGAAIALLGVALTVVIAAFKAVAAYGRNVEASTSTRAEVAELRKSVASIGERVGRLEARIEAERDLSTGHRRQL